MRFYWVSVLMALAAAVANGQTGQTKCGECHEQAKKIAGTAHGSLECGTCHESHEQYPHPTGIPKPTCGGCHEGIAAKYRLGVHGQALAKGNLGAPDCAMCHGDAHEALNPATDAFRRRVPETCGTCHDQVFARYKTSVHGKAAAEGVVAAPVCSTCHGEHQIQAASSSTSPVNPSHVPETCGRCHGDVTLAERFNLPRNTLVSFEASYHGLALKTGSQAVANCASCHGIHNILPSSDPHSTINAKNLPQTCGKCHPGAGSRFTIGHIHWVEGQAEPPAVRWVRVAYLALIPLVIGLMLLHNAGDWVRKVFQFRLRRTATVSGPALPSLSSFRMYAFERIQHALLAVSFTVLAWSGFALKYPDQWWARPLTYWESQWHVRGTIHRFAGASLIAISLLHAISLISSRKLRRHWHGLWPGWSDVTEAIGRCAYNAGLRNQRPALSSHSYVEKAEYWAVVWGSVIMSLTGVMLWANRLILSWFPKLALDVATAVHYYEAILATVAIFVWHFYAVIFDPEVYPVDPAWLTGYSVRERGQKEDQKEDQEHPEHAAPDPSVAN